MYRGLSSMYYYPDVGWVFVHSKETCRFQMNSRQERAIFISRKFATSTFEESL